MIEPNWLAKWLASEWDATEQPIEQRGLGLSYEPQPAPEGPMHYPIRAGQFANQMATGIVNSLAPVAKYYPKTHPLTGKPVLHNPDGSISSLWQRGANNDVGHYGTVDEAEREAQARTKRLGDAWDDAGSYHLAWPSFITDGIDGFNSLWDRAAIDREGLAGSFDPELGKEAAGGSMMAAGLAATGGLAAGSVPDNALASNAVRRGGANVIQGYRGVRDANKPVVSDWWWGSTKPEIANQYTGFSYTPDSAAVIPFEARFQNPMTVNARGSFYDEIPFEGWAGTRLGAKTLTTDDLGRIASQRGHDGLVVENVKDQVWRGNAGELATTIAALRPGTVFSATTGEQLFSNPRTAPLAPAAVNGDYEDDDFLSSLLRRYGER